MANKLAIVALAAVAVAAAPALARGRGGGRRPRPRQALRVCVDAAGENAFLEGCEVLSHQGLLVPQDVAIDTECVELDVCRRPRDKVRPGSAGPQATRLFIASCESKSDPYLRSCDPFSPTRARLRPRARKFPRRQAAAVVVGAHRVTHGALAPKAKL